MNTVYTNVDAGAIPGKAGKRHSGMGIKGSGIVKNENRRIKEGKWQK